ncbi:hypothetical protein [Shimia biformata]|uniref:hypothetical protein n=1 Tax=Shimia biformata TaxID=1294299 RepID=UPI001950FDE5|nr:hypothetical protein [Shimia biformata]
MICIDNAVELAMQTYISLPKRLTGVEVSRRQRDDICSSFVSLLDGLEEHASERLVGINLGEVEWFHRLRNELYHQGNGLTVERAKAEAYSQIALEMYRALFGVTLVFKQTSSALRLGAFLEKWIELEKLVSGDGGSTKRDFNRRALAILSSRQGYESKDYDEYSQLRSLRNTVVHGGRDPEEAISDEVFARMDRLLEKIRDLST